MAEPQQTPPPTPPPPERGGLTQSSLGRVVAVLWKPRETFEAIAARPTWGLALLIIVVLLLSIRRGSGCLTEVTVGLIIGGAIGNLLDWLFRDPGWLRGGVVDFIDFQWFPIFNVADTAITVGGALLIVNSWLSTRGDRTLTAPGPTETT